MKKKTATILVGLFIVLPGCSFFHRGKQVRTVANMQIISRILADLPDISTVNVRQVEEAVMSVNNGLDGWGNRILYEVNNVGEGPPYYVLVSPGSDRTLDLPRVFDYFREKPTDIRKSYSRDIVFIDGLPVTIAGK